MKNSKSTSALGLTGALKHAAMLRVFARLEKMTKEGFGYLAGDKTFVASLVVFELRSSKMLRAQFEQHKTNKHMLALDSDEDQNDFHEYTFKPLSSDTQSLLLSTGALAESLELLKTNPGSSQASDVFFTRQYGVAPNHSTADFTHPCLAARLNYTDIPARKSAHPD